jgi:hypothetical protein
MSQPVSHNKPPGNPITIRHTPTNSEVVSAASAGDSESGEEDDNSEFAHPHPASEVGNNLKQRDRWYDDNPAAPREIDT